MTSRMIAGAVFAVSLVHAQSAVEFEVATIKPAAVPAGRGAIRPGPRGGPGSGDPGRLTYSYSTIADLMANAYSVKRSQISGAPNWLDSERFDIVAKVPEGATKEQAKVMLQHLLAERFKLALHRETKEMPVYALVVGSKGPKLKETSIAEAPPAPDAPPPPRPGMRGMKMGPEGCPEMPGRAGTFTMMTPNGECMISNGQMMADLAAQLSNGFDRPVTDQTGLKGRYDFKLRYDPASMAGGRGGPKDALDPAPAGGEGAASIFSALQEQLGLKLEARKGAVEVLVIDHVEKTAAKN